MLRMAGYQPRLGCRMVPVPITREERHQLAARIRMGEVGPSGYWWDSDGMVVSVLGVHIAEVLRPRPGKPADFTDYFAWLDGAQIIDIQYGLLEEQMLQWLERDL